MYSIFTKYSNCYTNHQSAQGYVLLELVIALVFFATAAHVLVTLFGASNARYATAQRYVAATQHATTQLERWYSNVPESSASIDPRYKITQQTYHDAQAQYVRVIVSFSDGGGSSIELLFVGCKPR